MDAGISLLANPALPPVPHASRNLDHLHETAREFEEVFLAQMLQPMLSGLIPEEPFGGGPGEEMWQSMLVKEYGKAIAERGGIGIADAVVREALLAQEHGKELPR
ncbi:MAG: rod-binding protein [Rhodoplanes sp.]|jgi:peptidoglycan hydrolase FlgJ